MRTTILFIISLLMAAPAAFAQATPADKLVEAISAQQAADRLLTSTERVYAVAESTLYPLAGRVDDLKNQIKSINESGATGELVDDLLAELNNKLTEAEAELAPATDAIENATQSRQQAAEKAEKAAERVALATEAWQIAMLTPMTAEVTRLAGQIAAERTVADERQADAETQLAELQQHIAADCAEHPGNSHCQTEIAAAAIAAVEDDHGTSNSTALSQAMNGDN